MKALIISDTHENGDKIKRIVKFAYWRIYKALVELNKSLFPEITFGNEAYLDIFKEETSQKLQTS